MKVAIGQFAVSYLWQENVQTCLHYMDAAHADGADLLVLPEAVLARDDNDPDLSVKSAQAVHHEFIQPLCEQSRNNQLTTILTLHVKTTAGRAANTLLAIREGEVIARYQKLHLYDAFNMQESRLVDAGDTLPPLIEVAGFKVGLMTCYDLRFPEMALSLALAGAEVLVLPAAWLRGPNKEMHWSTLLAARALDTTCYVVASGECGNKNIGHSQIVDPLGVVMAAANQRPALFYAELESQHLSEVRAMLPVLKNRRFALPHLL
ncbi:deaminated glutathione amidase [Buttiauxella agrestis]|uniref:deaminated glutathione amidase n=1 Tax=Buttiauxella agrestis TaxID=82977 RepID=UPI00155F7658|nr:deaminated glutathione amidase [Buttiauxella agrestis]BCG10296.1 hydrolase [Buttiauxella agrestis]